MVIQQQSDSGLKYSWTLASSTMYESESEKQWRFHVESVYLIQKGKIQNLHVQHATSRNSIKIFLLDIRIPPYGQWPWVASDASLIELLEGGLHSLETDEKSICLPWWLMLLIIPRNIGWYDFPLNLTEPCPGFGSWTPQGKKKDEGRDELMAIFVHVNFYGWKVMCF